jgi:hypothetical protein
MRAIKLLITVMEEYVFPAGQNVIYISEAWALQLVANLCLDL